MTAGSAAAASGFPGSQTETLAIVGCRIGVRRTRKERRESDRVVVREAERDCPRFVDVAVDCSAVVVVEN